MRKRTIILTHIIINKGQREIFFPNRNINFSIVKYLVWSRLSLMYPFPINDTVTDNLVNDHIFVRWQNQGYFLPET